MLNMTYPVLLQVVRQVGNHDLGLGGNAILGGTTLLALAGLTRSSIFVGLGTLFSCQRLVRRLGDLAGYICRGGFGGSGLSGLDGLSTLGSVGLFPVSSGLEFSRSR